MSKSRRKHTRVEGGDREERAKGRKLMKLLNTDIKDLEIGDSLRRLGNIQVMEWDFRGSKRRQAGALEKAARKKIPDEELQLVAERLKNFLGYVSGNLIDEPERSEISFSEISPGVLQLRLVVVKRDLAMLVGRGGQTAETIRSVVKGMGKERGVDVLLKIVAHEEEGKAS